MMQKRDVVLTAVFSSLAALILIGGIGAACYFFHKRRRKREDDDEEAMDGPSAKIEATTEKKSKLNGFLSLKTPLISTKTLGTTGSPQAKSPAGSSSGAIPAEARTPTAPNKALQNVKGDHPSKGWKLK
ncbi:hypothetical protein MML48_9g00013092 [Holotrichia oblita]|uniref:Uncharacterized protein n=1 Tax=Holotrichia oblita TaxID=644536 RepID=A0ACB9SHN7_HOLOL|nr:hypothetical protein MML48_9g00013092 [Holotrichia oblita]